MLSDAPQGGALAQLVFAHEPRPVAGRPVSPDVPSPEASPPETVSEVSPDMSERIAKELSSVSHGA